ncbi:hypothetical protein CEXT_603441 [Caerostris extrusa]|uniref:Uncharacterized protein n=1 Tax=Caerostris extrusa TaxID=172846 RepID=A0AAV4PYH7_CAEEX|nr:hypothetical protein CEXT_603441 [Caerostris extrusa]
MLLIAGDTREEFSSITSKFPIRLPRVDHCAGFAGALQEVVRAKSPLELRVGDWSMAKGRVGYGSHIKMVEEGREGKVILILKRFLKTLVYIATAKEGDNRIRLRFSPQIETKYRTPKII